VRLTPLCSGKRIAEHQDLRRRQEPLALPLGELLDMPARVRADRPLAPPFRDLEDM